MKLLFVLLLALALGVQAGAAQEAKAGAPEGLQGNAWDSSRLAFVETLNEARRKLGLPPVRPVAALTQARRRGSGTWTRCARRCWGSSTKPGRPGSSTR